MAPMPKKIYGLLFMVLIAGGAAQSQGIRSHTRPAKGTIVNESQAADLTLTLNAAVARPIQQWIRTVGVIDRTGRILSGVLYAPESGYVKVGQRVRTFTPDSKSSMLQGYVTRVSTVNGQATVQVTLAAPAFKNNTNFVMEIVAERGEFLSIPNEAIIEEGDKHFAYVQQQPGHYVPQEIDIGVQGELYTQVLSGLNAGDQVVTFGSFFIDAEYKLKGIGETTATQ